MTASTFLSDLLGTIADRGRAVLARQRPIPEARAAPSLAELCRALISRRGEASGVAIAREIFDRWDKTGHEARRAFLKALATDFGPKGQELERAIAEWRSDPSPAALLALHSAAEPARQEVIRRLNLAPGGTARLVKMREGLFRHLDEEPVLEVLDTDFQHLFGSWFNRGFLVLKRIGWSTPANILEKIIRYEAVHAIRDWDDLRRRIEPEDRRLFAFFHPQMVDDPLIFVEVALTTTVPESIEELLSGERGIIEAEGATTAVFYSISNCHEGLRGVSFGNFLIKQVAEDLKRELPKLSTFVTLSPVPGFAHWLAAQMALGSDSLLPQRDFALLSRLQDPAWAAHDVSADLRDALLGAAAQYFLRAKTRRGRPVDPVARFHLGNGARLERINYLGDRSAKAMAQAHGLMVNYLYDLESIERNHEGYAEKGTVAASAAVQRLLKAENAPAAPRSSTATARLE